MQMIPGMFHQIDQKRLSPTNAMDEPNEEFFEPSDYFVVPQPFGTG